MDNKTFMEKVTILAKQGKTKSDIMEALQSSPATFNSKLVTAAMETGIPIPKMTIGRKQQADRDWAKVKTNLTFILGKQFTEHLNLKVGDKVAFKKTEANGVKTVTVSKLVEK